MENIHKPTVEYCKLLALSYKTIRQNLFGKLNLKL
jgi:hypothetical protein